MPTIEKTLYLYVPFAMSIFFNPHWTRWALVARIDKLGIPSYTISSTGLVIWNFGLPAQPFVIADYPHGTAQCSNPIAWLDSNLCTFHIPATPYQSGYVEGRGYEWRVDVEISTPDYYFYNFGIDEISPLYPGDLYFPLLDWTGTATQIDSGGAVSVISMAWRFLTEERGFGTAPKVTKNDIQVYGEIARVDAETTKDTDAQIAFAGWQVYDAESGDGIGNDLAHYDGKPPYFATELKTNLVLPEGKYLVQAIIIDHRGYAGSFMANYYPGTGGIKYPIRIDTSLQMIYDRRDGALIWAYNTFERWEEGYNEFFGFGSLAYYQVRAKKSYAIEKTVLDNSGSEIGLIADNEFLRFLGRYGAAYHIALSEGRLYSGYTLPPPPSANIASYWYDENYHYHSQQVLTVAESVDGSKVIALSRSKDNWTDITDGIYRTISYRNSSGYTRTIFEKVNSLSALAIQSCRLLRIQGGYLLVASLDNGLSCAFSDDECKTWTEFLILSEDGTLLGMSKSADDSFAFVLIKTPSGIVRVVIYLTVNSGVFELQKQEEMVAEGLPCAQVFLPAVMDCDGVTTLFTYLKCDLSSDDKPQQELAISHDFGQTWEVAPE